MHWVPYQTTNHQVKPQNQKTATFPALPPARCTTILPQSLKSFSALLYFHAHISPKYTRLRSLFLRAMTTLQQIIPQVSIPHVPVLRPPPSAPSTAPYAPFTAPPEHHVPYWILH